MNPKNYAPKVSRDVGETKDVETQYPTDLEAQFVKDGTNPRMSETAVSIKELNQGAGGKGE